MRESTIEMIEDEEDCEVLINGRAIEIVDGTEHGVVAECSLEELGEARVDDFPPRLALHVRDEKGFGTHLFHELTVGRDGSESIREVMLIVRGVGRGA